VSRFAVWSEYDKLKCNPWSTVAYSDEVLVSSDDLPSSLLPFSKSRDAELIQYLIPVLSRGPLHESNTQMHTDNVETNS
jgi:hypothetical protein